MGNSTQHGAINLESSQMWIFKMSHVKEPIVQKQTQRVSIPGCGNWGCSAPEVLAEQELAVLTYLPAPAGLCWHRARRRRGQSCSSGVSQQQGWQLLCTPRVPALPDGTAALWEVFGIAAGQPDSACPWRGDSPVPGLLECVPFTELQHQKRSLQKYCFLIHS